MNPIPDLTQPLLALDTSTPAASAALRYQGEISAAFHQGHAKHTEVLLPMIDELLSAADLTMRDIAGIIISAGPGAFTGLRVGASMAAGLAAAYQTPIACLSSLALLAASAPQGKILALMDARMRQHYAGFYERSEQGLQALAVDGLYTAETLPTEWIDEATHVIAAGELYCAERLRHFAVQNTIPEARYAFSALNLARWQSPLQAIDLQYLRNEITS